jgi:hypothetical protein
MDTEQKQKILEEFLERWPGSVVRKMTLSDYVGVLDKNTFTYWVETKTRALGSIKGWDSIKFGIYRRSKPEKRNKNYPNDDLYTWMSRFGLNREEAFEAVKKTILDIIEFAERGEFAKIDTLRLPDLFKWKVASLYSNERLVPIFKHDVLLRLAAAYGLNIFTEPRVSEIHEVLISNKPTSQDIYSYMDELYEQYGTDHHQQGASPPEGDKVRVRKRRTTRKAATSKNVLPQTRSQARSYIADLKHNKIQEALRLKLIEQHGEDAVFLEKNWVDVKVVLTNEIIFYEVKSASYASDCIEEALGQILGYVFNDEDSRKKRIVVVGQYPPNTDDQRFIEYVKSTVKIEFGYEHMAI